MKDNWPWWIAKDVCDILGYTNSRKAIKDHCKHKETFSVTIRDTGKGSVQKMTIIPESDVYRLIIRSKLPEAEKFEIWVMEEVLPSIRKTGTYSTPGGHCKEKCKENCCPQPNPEILLKQVALIERNTACEEAIMILNGMKAFKDVMTDELKTLFMAKYINLMTNLLSNP